MVVEVTFKTPDAIYYALKDLGIEEEWQKKELEDKLKTWIKHDEYIRIAFDLDAMTATVKKA